MSDKDDQTIPEPEIFFTDPKYSKQSESYKKYFKFLFGQELNEMKIKREEEKKKSKGKFSLPFFPNFENDEDDKI